MSASGWHWQPLINGYSDHIPLEFRELAPRMHGFPSMESFAELRQRRARYVVMHLNLYGRRDRERMLERAAGLRRILDAAERRRRHPPLRDHGMAAMTVLRPHTGART